MNGPDERSEDANCETTQASQSEPGRLPSPSEKSQLILSDGKKPGNTLPSRGPTGPRTPAGKQGSKYNATRHGIFSNVVVLKGESRRDYETLLDGLLSSLQPVGDAEEILVEKLAMLLWRHRRLAIAEGAEICKGQEFQEWDREQQQHWEAEEQARKTTEGATDLDTVFEPKWKEGLIWRAENPEILDRCLELLDELREEFKANGFSSNMSMSILETVYGQRDRGHLRETLFDVYDQWADIAEVPEEEGEERKEEGYPTPEECKEYFLKALDAEISRLKRNKEELLEIEARRTELEKLRHSIPDSASLDRLMRYETTLERSFDRTLAQLERLQRMRLGQPVPPRLEVKLSKN